MTAAMNQLSLTTPPPLRHPPWPYRPLPYRFTDWAAI